MLIETKCSQCGVLFKSRKKGTYIPKFCSFDCYWENKKGKSSWNKGIPCREETKKKLSEQRKGKHFSPDTEFTSERMRGKKNNRWKGGKYVSYQGYVMILNPEHHRANTRGYVPEQILVAEKILGRLLEDSEVVHHLNHIKTDNRPKNLKIFANRSDHMKFHNLERIRNKKGQLV